MSGFASDGFTVTPHDPGVLAWAKAAHCRAIEVASDPAEQARHLRHGSTWFVGVDALPNARDGSVDNVPLAGPWGSLIDAPEAWHRAQLSIVYPGYPRADPDESDAAHGFRARRYAAHVDGLLPHGPEKRRFLGEWHSFILGLPLNISDAAPLMVWPGSHVVMGDALRDAIADQDPRAVDLTDAYKAARREVFDQIEPVVLRAEPGQAMVLHRHLLHGVAPFAVDQTAPPEGRMIAYFRPLCEGGPDAWLAADRRG